LNKTKEILEPLVAQGVRHAQLIRLWEAVKSEITRRNSGNFSLEQSNTAKRTQALEYYQNGNYNNARRLLEELLHDNFEVLSTRLHLARLALITDDLEEAAQQTTEVWKLRKEAKNYVIARILWFKITLVYLCKSSPKIFFGQIKTVLQKEDAFMEWKMQPALDHIKPQITEHQYALLSALVAAMSYKANLEKLNDFEEWRNSKPEDIE
jgi:hypothetical protein